MSHEAQAARAARLREFLDNPDVKDAIEAVQADIMADWRACREPAERENLWHAQRVFDLLLSKLTTWSSADRTALRRSK